jgi:hypothetical protein
MAVGGSSYGTLSFITRCTQTNVFHYNPIHAYRILNGETKLKAVEILVGRVRCWGFRKTAESGKWNNTAVQYSQLERNRLENISGVCCDLMVCVCSNWRAWPDLLTLAPGWSLHCTHAPLLVMAVTCTTYCIDMHSWELGGSIMRPNNFVRKHKCAFL